MFSYERTVMKTYKVCAVDLLLVVLLTIITERRISGQHLCPALKVGECTTSTTSEVDYANIYSRTYCMNFMCDTKKDGGGWIVIQRRVYQDTYFNRTWKEYKYGFGSVCDDYWLGNENIHKLTTTGQYELRIDMKYRNTTYFAKYREFYIDGEADKYRLHLKEFSGNVVNEFIKHDGMMFTTRDRDNDQWPGHNCAADWKYNNGWWYHWCHHVNLNGHFHMADTIGASVIWESLTGDFNTLSSVEMKIRKRLTR